MENLLNQITNYLLTQSWQITLLVLVIASATWLLKTKSAHVRYLLWLIVLAKSLVPPLITIPLAILPQKSLVEPVPILPAELPAATIEKVNTAITEPPISISAPAVKEKTVRLTIRQWLGVGWILGAIVFVLIALIKALKTELWLRRQRKPLPAKLDVKIEELFSNPGIRTFPKLWLIDGIGQPFVWGLLRGSIYLPADFIKVNSDEHRRGVLGHELSHILRFDAAVNCLQVVAQAIFWFHPFVWWANKRIRAEREKCCDEIAIARLGAKVRDYSIAIVNILVEEHESTRPVPSLAVAGPVKNIEERIKTMLRPGKKFYKRPSLIAVTVVLVLALLTAPTALVLTARAETKPTAEQKPETAKSIHRAASDGDIEQVKLLLSKGADVNEKYPRGKSPLHYAAEKGHAEVAKLLISKGAYVNTTNRNALTPLHFAAMSGDKQTVELLLSKGAYLDAKQIDGKTPLFEAMISPASGYKEVVKFLVSKGSKVPEFHLAAYLGDTEKLKKCLQDGMDINSQENFCCTALHAAANSGKKDIVEFLISKGANIDAKDTSGMTPLYYAAIHNYEDIADLLLAKGADVNAKLDEYNYTLLHYAIWEQRKDPIKLLISKGANVNVKDNAGGFTPLDWAIWYLEKDMVELLINKGADVNAEDDDGYTPLYWAAMEGRKEIVELLITKGATSIPTIHLASSFGDLAKVKSLIEAGADVNEKYKGGRTPLFAAVFADHNDVAKFLIARGADVNAKGKNGQTPLHDACQHVKMNMVELLIAGGADVNAKDNVGVTPLHIVFFSGGHMDLVEMLIAKGANVNVKLTGRWDGWWPGLTPLHSAVESGHTKIVGLLIDKGADINAQKSDGQTPLHGACKLGYKDMIELLIAKGADINAKDNKEQTALSLAKEQGHEDIVELLRKHGAKE